MTNINEELKKAKIEKEVLNVQVEKEHKDFAKKILNQGEEIKSVLQNPNEIIKVKKYSKFKIFLNKLFNTI